MGPTLLCMLGRVCLMTMERVHVRQDLCTLRRRLPCRTCLLALTRLQLAALVLRGSNGLTELLGANRLLLAPRLLVIAAFPAAQACRAFFLDEGGRRTLPCTNLMYASGAVSDEEVVGPDSTVY